MLIVWSDYHVDAPDLHAYGAWALDLAEQFKATEPGCDLYELGVHPLDPRRRHQFEVFKSLADFDAHMRNPIHDSIRHHDGYGIRNLQSRIFEVSSEMPVDDLRDHVAQIERQRSGEAGERQLRERWSEDAGGS